MATSGRRKKTSTTFWPGYGKVDEKGVAEAQHRAEDLLKQLKGGAKLEDLAKKYSEDPGSAKNGQSYQIDDAAPFVEPFKRLSLRLQPGEVGIVKSDFGYHVVKRIR